MTLKIVPLITTRSLGGGFNAPSLDLLVPGHPRGDGRYEARGHRTGRVLSTFGALGLLVWAVRRAPWRRAARAERDRRGDADRLLGHERLAMVAHELRTPVGAIRHAAVALEAAADTRPQVRAACAIIRRQTERVGRLVDDLLVPSGARVEALGLGREPLDLGAVVSETVEAVRGLVEERGHKLLLALPSAPLQDTPMPCLFCR